MRKNINNFNDNFRSYNEKFQTLQKVIHKLSTPLGFIMEISIRRALSSRKTTALITEIIQTPDFIHTTTSI